jgi:hypothetical protein
MPTAQPVRTLCATLEATRLRAIEVMAAEATPSQDALRDLATLQTALTAVREVIKESGVKVGFGGDDGELEKAAVELAERK